MPSVEAIIRKQTAALVADIKAAIRDNIGDVVQQIAGTHGGLSSSVLVRLAPASSRAGSRGRKARARDMRCLSPACRTVSRGPRFRYLCERHERASEKQVAAWRELRRKRKAA